MTVSDYEQIAQGANKQITLLEATLAGAVSAQVSDETPVLDGVNHISLEAKFVRAGGGTTCKVWIQTTLDGGTTWFDIACFAFTTTTANKLHSVTNFPSTPMTPGTAPVDGALADDTVLSGVIGNQFRTKMTTTGTYTGASSVTIEAVFSR